MGPCFAERLHGYDYIGRRLFIVAYGWAGYELFAGSGYSSPINLNWSTTLKPSMFILVFAELIALYMIGMKVAQKNNWINTLTSM